MAIDSGYCGNGAALDSGYWESGEDTNVPTNADHIRSMTDEELARKIMHLNFCPPDIDERKECGANANCHRCWVDWLKQPWKETT